MIHINHQHERIIRKPFAANQVGNTTRNIYATTTTTANNNNNNHNNRNNHNNNKYAANPGGPPGVLPGTPHRGARGQEAAQAQEGQEGQDPQGNSLEGAGDAVLGRRGATGNARVLRGTQECAVRA